MDLSPIPYGFHANEIVPDILIAIPSTTEGFLIMNDGEYYVSAENLAENVQVGDMITIWFDGTIEETSPAQLGQIYRITKAV